MTTIVRIDNFSVNQLYSVNQLENSGNYSPTIFYESINFEEALSHCRWKTVLRNVLTEIKINISKYYNKTFEEIITLIYSICESVKGIGMLSVYDITSAICKYYKINIDKVYIIGNGPKRAVKILNIPTKHHIISNKIKIKYADIRDVRIAFDNNCYELDEEYRTTTDGDKLETHICKWQKTQNNT